MKNQFMLSCLGSLALLAAVGSASAAERFSVPFSLQTSNSEAGPIQATFTLTKPAILDAFFISCTGPALPLNGVLNFDNGPAGVNGTTGVAGSSNTTLVVGAGANATGLVFSFGGGPISATQLGVPINSTYSISVNLSSTGPNGSEPLAGTCTGYTVLRSLGN